MNFNEKIENFFNELYPYLPEVLTEFDLKQRGEKTVSGNTARLGYFYDTTPVNRKSNSTARVSIWEKNPASIYDLHEGQSTYLPDYLIKSTEHPVSTWAEAIKYLVSKTGLVSPLGKPSPEQVSRFERLKLRSDLSKWFNETLNEAPQELEAICNKRGLTVDQVNIIGLGICPDKTKIELYAKGLGYGHDTVQDVVWEFPKTTGNEHKFTIPLKNKRGEIVGFKIRISNQGLSSVSKYTSTKAAKDAKFRNWHFAQPYNKELDTYLVEGEFDAYLGACKVKANFISLEGKAKTPSPERIKDLKAENIYILLDGETQTNTNVCKLVKMLYTNGLNAFVLSLPNGLDPADYLKDKQPLTSLEFQNSKDIKKHYGFDYLLLDLMAKQQDGYLIGKDKLLKEVLHIAGLIPSRQATDLINRFNQLSGNKYDFSNLQNIANKFRLQAEEKQKEKALKTAFKQANDLIEKGYIEKAYNLVNKAPRPSEGFKAILNSPASAIIDELKSASEGFKLGFGLGVNVPKGAPTIIAGLPAMGKTTFMLNIIIQRLIKGQPVYFFTYEEPRAKLTAKLINCFISWIENETNDSFQIQAYSEEHKGKHEGRSRLAIITALLKAQNYNSIPILGQAVKQVFEWLDTGNLTLVDQTLNDTDLIETLKQISEPEALVFIDYIQKIPSKSERKTATVSNKLQATCKDLNIYMVIGAQFNRNATMDKNTPPEMYQLKDASEIEQDASLILRIHKHTGQAEEERTISVLKNREGILKEQQVLFKGADTSIIELEQYTT